MLGSFPSHTPTHNSCVLVRLARRLAVPASAVGPVQLAWTATRFHAFLIVR
jgi:hypothetical protein